MASSSSLTTYGTILVAIGEPASSELDLSSTVLGSFSFWLERGFNRHHILRGSGCQFVLVTLFLHIQASTRFPNLPRCRPSARRISYGL
ncbi:hypothetical protein A2U01_0025722 [Trifolium medium]|uniref:Uncharacterized protein n=1 Tax=Trifolium medium TaxID=97028 RepID=A0A392P1J9_9FABA|nr:hypothetical protein [Trifolium medium]